MSKTNKTTKIATFKGWAFSDEFEFWSDDLRPDNTGDCVGAMTSAGVVSARNTFSAVLPGQRVVLRKGAGKSWGGSPWVMTGLA
jgi:hypothetical protein